MGENPAPESPKPCNQITQAVADEEGSIVIRSNGAADMRLSL